MPDETMIRPRYRDRYGEPVEADTATHPPLHRDDDRSSEAYLKAYALAEEFRGYHAEICAAIADVARRTSG